VDVYILRHGEAGKSLAVGELDAERSLTPDGKKEVSDVCRRLQGAGLNFELIASSPLKRARETAGIAAKTFEMEVEEWPELRPDASSPTLAKRLSRVKRDSSVLLVGHEPFLSSFIGEVIGASPEARILLKKSGLARISVDAFTPKMAGELRWLLSPRVMRRLK
jgi:phosphohistidine phosphatase